MELQVCVRLKIIVRIFVETQLLMHTIRLKINDKVYDKILWLLSKFSKHEVEIINEDAEFFENQKYLEKELGDIISGNAQFIEMDEAEQRLENLIKQHENRI